jgi:hypothetical protein
VKSLADTLIECWNFFGYRCRLVPGKHAVNMSFISVGTSPSDQGRDHRGRPQPLRGRSAVLVGNRRTSNRFKSIRQVWRQFLDATRAKPISQRPDMPSTPHRMACDIGRAQCLPGLETGLPQTAVVAAAGNPTLIAQDNMKLSSVDGSDEWV